MVLFSFSDFILESVNKPSKLPFEEVDNQEEITISNVFQKLFIPKTSLCIRYAFKNTDGTYEIDKNSRPYKTDILAHHDNIIVMTIENNRIKSTTNDKLKVLHDHHPFAYVIIDYAHNFIATEHNGAFGSKQNKCPGILNILLNSLFAEYGIIITITPREKVITDFWEAVTTFRTQLHDKVKKICMDFHNTSANVDSCLLARTIQDICRRSQSHGLVSFESETTNELNIDDIHDDLMQLANICYVQQEYDLSVHFMSYGVYRYGSGIYAQFSMEETMIQEFVENVQDIDIFENVISLNTWMNNMRIAFEEYGNTTPLTEFPEQSYRR